jgi:hypothetical protein
VQYPGDSNGGASQLLIADAISFAGKRDSQGNLLFKLIYVL